MVTEPPAIRGVYESWPACQAAVAGVPGARFQAVASRAEAEAILRGEGVRLEPGLYAFVDGNHRGGIGVVLVEQPPTGDPEVRQEAATTVFEVFGASPLPGLGSRAQIARALGRLRNILAELGGLYAALALAPAPGALTVVHDYAGVGAWFEGTWQARDPLVAAVVAACRARARERGLAVAFRRQRGHASTFAGRHDLARFNARADALARRAAGAGSP